MVVGVLRLTLSLHGARSLKDKRQVVRKLVDRVRGRFNVSIAEVEGNDLWQKIVLGVTVVSNDHAFCDEVLAKVTREVENASEAQLIDRELEIETYSEMHKDIADKPLLDELGSGDPGEEWDAEAEELALQADAREEQEAEALALAARALSTPAAPAGKVGPAAKEARPAAADPAPGKKPPAKGPAQGGWLKEEDFE
jgi:uncharacterized protein